METFDKLEEAVIFCGNYAVNQQLLVQRNYKRDGSVLTETDLYIDSYLKNSIHENFPNSVLITEESESTHDLRKSSHDFYFIIDPIDGTDMYSQGAPSWCIAIGILDKMLSPVGCMINAPRWGLGTKNGLFFRLDPGESLFLNHSLFSLSKPQDSVRQIAMSSDAHQVLDISKYTGKCRTFGSTIIHLLAPVIHSQIDAALCTSGYIWDIAAAHSVLNHLGLSIQKADGTCFSYSEELLRGKPNKEILFAGSKNQCEILRTILSE